MIPRHNRLIGSGGGGTSKWAQSVPFFCKKCGNVVGANQVSAGVDVCKRCRVGNIKRKKGK